MSEMTSDTVNESAAWPYSGFWRRVAATMVDNLILILPVMLIGAFTFGVGGIIIAVIYGAWFESSPHRATPGKMACGIRVETVSGERISFGLSLGRQLLKLLGHLLSVITWLIFFLPAAFTERKQGLHDLAVSTVVRHQPGKGAPTWLVIILAGILPFVFVLGILAAIAIPAYQDYVNRAKTAQMVNLGSMAKLDVEDYFERKGELPRSQSDLSGYFDNATAAGAVFANGRIELKTRDLVPPGTLHFTPRIENNGLKWKCGADNIRPQWLPVSCR